MSNFSIKPADESSLMQQLASKFDTGLESDFHVSAFDTPGSYGSVKIMGTTVDPGMTLLIIEGCFKNDFTLSVDAIDENPLIITYCREGHCFHLLAGGKVHYQIPPLGSSISWNPKNEQEFRISADIPVSLTLLITDKNEFRSSIFSELQVPMDASVVDTLFDYLDGDDVFLYQSYYSITISECIKKMQDSNHTGLINKVFWDTRVMELLYLQLLQYNTDINSGGKLVLLRKHDLGKIVMAKNVLMTHYKEPPTILQLSKKVGINQQKLKQGFKRLYGTTINKYVMNFRLETAASFLISGMSVREVVHDVGYTNKSYFARKFRDRYGVLPREYRKKIMTRIHPSSDMSQHDDVSVAASYHGAA